MEDKILNLTQHSATNEQLHDGVFEPGNKPLVQKLLTFEEPPTPCEIRDRAEKLAEIAANHGVKYAMIGGAPYLMAHLETALLLKGVTPCYSFSKREVLEKTLPDGSVKKESTFRHVGFIFVN